MSKKLTRSASFDASLEATTPRCIQGFIKYVQSKGNKPGGFQTWRTCNETNVVEFLMQIMEKKGFDRLTFATFKPLVDYIATNHNPTRDDIIKIITQWKADGTYVAKSTKKLRNAVTISGISLSKATQKQDKTYTDTDYNIANSKPIKIIDPQLRWCTTIVDPKDKNRKEVDFISGFKKPCANCWICGEQIYVYELMLPDKTKQYVKCGEDEHVLPPGIGNVFGLLYPTLREQLVYEYDSAVAWGLRASHSWCNQVKAGYSLVIAPGTGRDAKYTLNTTTLDKILEKAKKWLEEGENNVTGIDYFQHSMADKPKERTKYINQIKSTMSTFIGILCDKLNAMAAINTMAYTMYQLRLLFFSCCLAKDIIFKDITGFQTSWAAMGGAIPSGKKMIGGTAEDEENVCQAIILEAGKDECISEEQLLAYDTATHVKFDDYGNIIGIAQTSVPSKSQYSSYQTNKGMGTYSSSISGKTLSSQDTDQNDRMDDTNDQTIESSSSSSSYSPAPTKVIRFPSFDGPDNQTYNFIRNESINSNIYRGTTNGNEVSISDAQIEDILRNKYPIGALSGTWEVRTDSHGKPYYYNPNTGQTAQLGGGKSRKIKIIKKRHYKSKNNKSKKMKNKQNKNKQNKQNKTKKM